MTRRFEIGPILVAAGSLLLLVSLFLDWYGAAINAWDAFELVDLLLAVLAVTALVAVAGTIAPEVDYVERRWLPGLVAAVAILVVAAIINPPPAAAGQDPETGAWVAFGAAMAMLVGAVLSLGTVSFSVAVEGRETRERVSAVDERQPTTETAAVMSSRRRGGTVADGEETPPAAGPTPPAAGPTRTDES